MKATIYAPYRFRKPVCFIALTQFFFMSFRLLGQQPFMLHDGTPVRLKLTRNLSSADARTGDTVDFEVVEDVKAGDTVVIARGATALATVTQAQPKRRMGRGGKLDVNIDSVRLVSGEKVPLRAVREGSGRGKTGAMTGAMVATSLVVWPAAPFFLLMHGKDVNVPKGTEITAYLQGEITLDHARFAPKTVSAVMPSGTAMPATFAQAVPAAAGARGMTNSDVIALKSAGLSDTLLITKIRNSPAQYRLETEDLIALKKAAVSEAVIQSMLEVQSVNPGR
jgi:hypothetical protein